jgi:hypothetical protein
MFAKRANLGMTRVWNLELPCLVKKPGGPTYALGQTYALLLCSVYDRSRSCQLFAERSFSQ